MSRPKDRQAYTFLIVPHGKSRTISLQLSHVQVKLLAVALLFALGAAVFLLAHAVLLKHANSQLQAENRQHEERIAAMSSELARDRKEMSSLLDQVQEINAYMRQLEQLEAEIRNKSGMIQLPSADSGGSGGVERLSPFAPAMETQLSTADMIRQSSQTLLQLERKIPEKLKKTEHLLRDVNEMNHKLAHTPSIYPAIGVVTSRFGYRRDPFHGAVRFHDGFDIANRYRTPVYATANGTVVFADRRQGYGKTVEIAHSKTLRTSYSHLSELIVSPGQAVQKGQMIGYMGSTGRSTGVHVHYMVYENGQPVDPEKYMPAERRN
jgi:murein DD-endopeptidase MepM/ murein hydrolase activator NlpD